MKFRLFMRLTCKIELTYLSMFFLAVISPLYSSACTSAIIGSDVNPYGRPILWKHRDTSAVDNKVEFVKPKSGEFSYVALFNSADKDLKEAWMGMNEYGFAIMNTASYNLKDDDLSSKLMDKEGFVMSVALKRCKTVDDFSNLLDTLPRPMGVEANFGVIDALGNGAYFESNNHSYRRFDLKDSESHVLIRTNYSHSGRPNEGYGFIREANACHLLAPYISERAVTPEVLTEYVSRSFYHDLKKKNYEYEDEAWIIDQDFIPRYKSTATVAIEGCKPVDDLRCVSPDFIKKEYSMWTGLGYPPVAEIYRVTCSENGVDYALRGCMDNGHAPAAEKSKEMRDIVFPIKKGNGDKYIDFSTLFNNDGTGIVQKLRKQNFKTYQIEREKRDAR